MEDIDLAAVVKGKLSLAEALKQIDSVNTAFSKAERIEKKLVSHESALTEVKKTLDACASIAVLNAKLEDFSSQISRQIAHQFQEFSSNYLFQLNEKANMADIETIVSQRVTWTAFNNFSSQLGSVRSRLDKHILSDFEGFKTKMKLELASKANEKKADEEVDVEEIQQLKNRMTALEQKYREMFMDEGLDDSEDYDSQEAMDNFIEDADRAGQKVSDEEGENNEEEFVDIGNRISPMQTQEIKPQVALPVGFIAAVSPEVISPRSENFDTAKTEVSDDSTRPPEGKFESGQTEIPVKTVQEASPKYIEPVIERIPDPVYEKPPEPILEKRPEPAIQEKKPEFIDHSNDYSKPKSRSSIEVDNTENIARASRPRGASSRADGQSMTRKNSLASSMGGNNVGGGGMNSGMRALNKKVIGMQKDIETNKALIDEIKETLQDYLKEFGKVYEKIAETRARCEEVEIKRQGMEMSFIKALRRNGIDKKNKAKQVVAGTIGAEEMRKIQEQISRKNNKVKAMATYVEKVAADTICIKEKQNMKINEIIQNLKILDDSRANMAKQLGIVNETFVKIEQKLSGNIKEVQNELKELKGPMADLISDQQRENEMLNKNIKKQQEILNEVAAELKQPKLTVKTDDAHALTAKHKLSSSYRRNSVQTSQNWLEDIPDGTPLVLPRIKAASLSEKKQIFS